jgi:hypothetical protein
MSKCDGKDGWHRRSKEERYSAARNEASNVRLREWGLSQK